MWKDIPIYLALPFFQNFAAFSEYLNFIKQIDLKKDLFPTYSSSPVLFNVCSAVVDMQILP